MCTAAREKISNLRVWSVERFILLTVPHKKSIRTVSTIAKPGFVVPGNGVSRIQEESQGFEA